tara:strand:- start:1520 stop:2035 length:516 start_codon:yes stop_codon:yes gene_type:complete
MDSGALVVARHGENMGNGLSQKGYMQMKKLSGAISANYPSKVNNFSIISSPAERSNQSARVLCSKLRCGKVKLLEELWDDFDKPLGSRAGDLMGIYDEVENALDDDDVVVLVTHINLTKSFPRYVARSLTGQLLDFDPLKCGQAYMFTSYNFRWERLPDGKTVYRSKTVFE